MNPFNFLKSIEDVVQTSINVLDNYFEALDKVYAKLKIDPKFNDLNDDQITEAINKEIRSLGIMLPEEFDEQFNEILWND